MKLEQIPRQKNNIILNLFLFLRNRDAIIIEFFFLLLNAYILILVIAPPYSTTGLPLALRMLFQIIVTTLNLLALYKGHKFVRIASSVSNAAIMGLISAALLRANSPHTGTYVLIALLAIFVCWKIQIKQ